MRGCSAGRADRTSSRCFSGARAQAPSPRYSISSASSTLIAWTRLHLSRRHSTIATPASSSVRHRTTVGSSHPPSTPSSPTTSPHPTRRCTAHTQRQVPSMLTTDRSTQLDELLGISIAEFDIPDHIYERAVERYEHAARWLADCWPDGQGEIYTQGSIRLGTMIAPVNPQDEYDIDLVCRRDIVKETTTQKQLKRGVGGALA